MNTIARSVGMENTCASMTLHSNRNARIEAVQECM